MRRRGPGRVVPLTLALAVWPASAALAAPAAPPPAGQGAAPKAATPPPPRATPPATPTSAAPPPPGQGAPPPPGQAAAQEIAPEAGPPVDLSETWGYARSGAPRPRYVRRSSDPVFYAPNPVGYYSGVSVVGNQTPPHPVKKLGAKPSTLTWIGFERTSSGSRVFVQLSADPEYTVSQKGSVVTIVLRRTSINVRNNSRQLDLSYFKTPVRSARVKRKGRDAVLTIVLKGNARAEVGLVDGAAGSGYRLLVTDFAQTDATPTAANAPE